MRSLALFALASILPACGPASPPPDVPPAPTAPTAPAAAPTATATAQAEPPEAPSPLFPIVVNGSPTLRFFALAKGGVVIDGDWMSRPYRIDETGAHREPRLFDGIKGEGPQNAFLVYGVSGDWPRSGSMSINLPGDRGGTDVDLVWNGSSWAKAPQQPMGDMPKEVIRAHYLGGHLGGARWGKRSLYYLITSTDDGPQIPKFVLGGKGAGKPPAIAKGSGGCPTRLVGYSQMANLSSGEMVGIGKLCTGPDDYTYYTQTGPGALAVERWAKGSGKSTVAELPGSAGKGGLGMGAAGFLEVSPAEIFAYANLGDGDAATPYVARWDGKTWTDVSPKAPQAVTSMWLGADKTIWIELKGELDRWKGDGWERAAPAGVSAEIQGRWAAPDGTQWVRFGKDLWHLGANGVWEKLVMPREGKVRLVAKSVAWMGDQMMIVADGALLSTRKPPKVLDLAAVGDDGAAPAKKEEVKKVAFGRVGPPTASCKSLFVVLYKLSRVAPPDFDFPLTREALKGHTELSDVRFAETEDGGSRYLVAHVPNLEKGQKLVKLVRDKVKSSAPQLLCGEPPKTNRTIEIDLRTGAIKK